jgi:hypothetical protein
MYCYNLHKTGKGMAQTLKETGTAAAIIRNTLAKVHIK